MVMNSAKRAAALMVFALALPSSAALAQQQLPPDQTSQCPVTHDCRAVAHGMQTQAPPGQPEPPRTITCPVGTVRIPNTNRCKVVSTGP
jgi:hypothetical protein